MQEKELDWADQGGGDVSEKVRGILKGAKTRSEVLARLQGYKVKPEPGKFFSVQGHGDGFDVLFLIGEGQRPRTVHCIEPEFDEFV